MHAATDAALDFRILLPQAMAAGRPIPLLVRLTNTESEPADLYLFGRTVAFDVVVMREDGTEVWRRLEGETVQSILQLRTLGPAESLGLTDTWDGRTRDGLLVPPGEYLVQALLPMEGWSLTTPTVPLRILPGTNDGS